MPRMNYADRRQGPEGPCAWPAGGVHPLVPLGEEVSDVAHGGLVRTAQGVERQRVELDVVVRADVRVALDVGLVEALQALRRGRIRRRVRRRVVGTRGRARKPNSLRILFACVFSYCNRTLHYCSLLRYRFASPNNSLSALRLAAASIRSCEEPASHTSVHPFLLSSSACVLPRTSSKLSPSLRR